MYELEQFINKFFAAICVKSHVALSDLSQAQAFPPRRCIWAIPIHESPLHGGTYVVIPCEGRGGGDLQGYDEAKTLGLGKGDFLDAKVC